MSLFSSSSPSASNLTAWFAPSSPKVLVTGIFAVLSLLGCDAKQPATETTAKTETAQTASTESAPAASANPASPASTETVTIYSSRNEQLIKPLLDKFTAETGTPVELITDKEGPLMERLKAEGQNTPADMLLTVDAGNLWQASQEGLLQPLQSAVVDANVPAKYRDANGEWTGLSLRARTMFYDPNKVQASELTTYADLADPKWKGKLCLRSSKKVYNQSLVASLIEHYGAAKTEQIVKGWVANLGAPIFDSDTKLLEAIAAGQCAVGIANTYYYGRLLEEKPDFPVKLAWANQGNAPEDYGVHVNISGAGIVKNASNPDGARQLIEWLSSDKAQSIYASSDKEFPVKAGVPEDPMLKSWGPFKQDDINVTIFGQRQVEATQLMDRAGYQ